MPSSPPTQRDRLWLWFLLACGATFLAIAACFALRPFSLGTALYLPVGAAGAIGVIIGIIRFRPHARTAWLLLAVSQVLFALGCVAFALQGPTFPGIADIFFISMSPPFIGAVASFTRRPAFKGHPGELLDAGIVAAGVALVIWLHLMEPVARAHGISVMARLVLMTYPILDLAVLLVALRLALIRAPRPVAYWLFMAGVTTALATDLMYVYFRVTDTYHGPRAWCVLGYLAASALFGVAGLHPSMTQLGQQPVTNCTVSTGRRIAFLSLVSLIAPAELAVAAWHGGTSRGDSLAIAGACVVLLSLILTRMAALE